MSIDLFAALIVLGVIGFGCLIAGVYYTIQATNDENATQTKDTP